eukprot:5281273-Alexandrium_andersonii.AAC.1
MARGEVARAGVMAHVNDIDVVHFPTDTLEYRGQATPAPARSGEQAVSYTHLRAHETSAHL